MTTSKPAACTRTCTLPAEHRVKQRRHRRARATEGTRVAGLRPPRSPRSRVALGTHQAHAGRRRTPRRWRERRCSGVGRRDDVLAVSALARLPGSARDGDAVFEHRHGHALDLSRSIADRATLFDALALRFWIAARTLFRLRIDPGEDLDRERLVLLSSGEENRRADEAVTFAALLRHDRDRCELRGVVRDEDRGLDLLAGRVSRDFDDELRGRPALCLAQCDDGERRACHDRPQDA